MRYSRQSSIIDPEVMKNLRFMIIGTGAIGRQVAVQLAAAGAEKFILFDHDLVEESNIANQGWIEDDLYKHKVKVLEQTILDINSKAGVLALPYLFNEATYRDEGRRYDLSADVVVCTVDSITTRKDIHALVHDKCELFLDGRMSAESCRIIALSGKKEAYSTTLFEPGEAYAGSCTARSTIYCANIAAGLLVAMTTRWMRQKNDGIVDWFSDFIFNIPNYTIEKLPC